MSGALFTLDRIQVASPCTASWDGMAGDEQVRFCSSCRKNVYNLSGMTRRQAEALVQEEEGRKCVRFYRRQDGTLLTQDCPVGVRRWWRRFLLGASAAAALLVTLSIGGLYLLFSPRPDGPAGNNLSVFHQIWFKFFPPQREVMGKICPPELNVPQPFLEMPPGEQPPP